MRGKKVIISIPVLLIGGTEIQTLVLVRVLADAGYDVTVCCYHENDPEMVSLMKQAGSEVILMNEDRSAGAISLVLKLGKLFKALNPDIVHVQYIAPGFLPVVAARLAGIKTIFATVHQPGRAYGRKEHLLLRTAARLCSVFFCNSRAVEESWFGDSRIFSTAMPDRKRRHYTIYNAVDTDTITGKISETDTRALKDSLGVSGRPVLGVVGRLRAEKGQAFLLEAMPDVIRAVPDARLLMVGDGPDMASLQAQGKMLGIDENIVWAGLKSTDDVYCLYGVMDVVAVPSIFEGFGLVAAEAMAAGKPVVASNVDGLAELVEDGETGLLVPPGDSAMLAKAIIALFDKPDMAKSMGQKGYTKIKEGFAPEGFSRAIINAYQVFR
jgi:L-malate glycosyltransferase